MSLLPKVIFEDQYLIVVYKPPGYLSEKDKGNQPNMEDWTNNYLKEKKSNNQVLIVHRLDKPVAGLLLLAKRKDILKMLNKTFEERKITKVYTAILEGNLKAKAGNLINYLIKDSESKSAKLAFPHESGAQKAELSFKNVKHFENYTVAEIFLKTGRYHQIRAQFSAFGHPIVGDNKYGSTQKAEDLIYLYASFLEFTHPVSQQKLSFSLPFPEFPLWKIASDN